MAGGLLSLLSGGNMIKKTLKIGAIAWVIAAVAMLVASLGVNVNARTELVWTPAPVGAPAPAPAPQPLEQMLVGTWRWTGGESYILVFRPDGTGLSGIPGLRTGFAWSVRDGRLFVDGVDQNIRVEGNNITLDRIVGTHTYFFYSSDTDAATSWTVFIVIGVLILLFVVGMIVLVVVLIIKLSRRNRHNAPPPPPPPPQTHSNW